MTPTVRRASLPDAPDPPGRGRSRGSPSPPSSPNRRTRRAPRRPTQIQTVVPAGRKVDRERSAGAPGDCPGGLQTSLEKNVLFKGGLQPPLPGGGRRRCSGPGRVAWRRPPSADATTRLHDRRAGPGDDDRSRMLDRPHRQSWLSWNAFIDRHGRPGRPDGAQSRWRVSPTSELGPWRPCESVPGVLPAPPWASRPTPSPPPAGVPGGRGRPAPSLGAAAVARPSRAGARVTAVTTRAESAASTRKDQRAGGNPQISEEKRQPTTDHDLRQARRRWLGGLIRFLHQRAIVPGRMPSLRSKRDPTAPTTQVRRSRPGHPRRPWTASIPVQCAPTRFCTPRPRSLLLGAWHDEA